MPYTLEDPPPGTPMAGQGPPDTRSGRSSLALHSWKWPRGRDVCIRLEPHELSRPAARGRRSPLPAAGSPVGRSPGRVYTRAAWLSRKPNTGTL